MGAKMQFVTKMSRLTTSHKNKSLKICSRFNVKKCNWVVSFTYSSNLDFSVVMTILRTDVGYLSGNWDLWGTSLICMTMNVCSYINVKPNNTSILRAIFCNLVAICFFFVIRHTHFQL